MANTTYKSDQITSGVPIPGFGAGGGQERVQYGRVLIPAAAATTDVFQLFYLPPHARVIGASFKVDDLDTGTTVTLSIGDTGGGVDSSGVAIAAAPGRYFSAVTTAQTGGLNTTMNVAGKYFRNGASKTLVQAILAAGPTTTAGYLEVSINYTCEEPQ